MKNYFIALTIFLFIELSLFSVESYQQRKFNMIHKQENYYACGASVIQFILKYSLDININQSDILSVIVQSANSLQTQGGISFLDIKKFLKKYSIDSDGILLKEKNLINVFNYFNFPIILHYKNNTTIVNDMTYNAGHFVILYYCEDKSYYVLDPSEGIVILSEKSLYDSFSGYCLIVKNHELKNNLQKLIEHEQKRALIEKYHLEN